MRIFEGFWKEVVGGLEEGCGGFGGRLWGVWRKVVGGLEEGCGGFGGRLWGV